MIAMALEVVKEFDPETQRRLESLGFRIISPSYAFADVKPPIVEPEILSYDVSPIEGGVAVTW